MGVNLKDLFERKEIGLSDLKGKTVAIDAYNMLYQFLTTIRQPDGTPLMDSQGRVTSHLNGLFYRTTKFLAYGLKPVFIFDGEAPKLKQEERKRRKALKEKAKESYESAKQAEDVEGMKKFASRTAYLSSEMVAEAKQLLEHMGIPVIQAPSEGEAQAAYMVKNGDAWATVSQDFDTLLYESPRLIQNLSVAGKRKVTTKLTYKTVTPELINLEPSLKELALNQDQLIALAILVGTDYNYKGVKGLGPKKAYKLVKEYGEDFDAMFKSVNFSEHCAASWDEIFKVFKETPVISDYEIKFKKADHGKIIAFLVDEYGFSRDRVENTLKTLDKQIEAKKQSSLSAFTK